MAKKTSQQDLTVERIYNEPDLSGVTIGDIGWSPDSRFLSYIRSDGFEAEFWAYDTASGERRMLFDFDRLKHSKKATPHQRHWLKRAGRFLHHWHTGRVRPPASLTCQWAPSGRGLLVAAPRGGPHLVSLDTDDLLPLTRSRQPVYDPKFSPDGRFVSYVRGYDLYFTDLTTGVESPLTQGSSWNYPSATPDTMGDMLWDSGHWWSPDSARVAYLQTDETQVPVFYMPNLTSGDGEVTPERYPQTDDPLPVIVLKVVDQRGRTILVDTRQWAGFYLARVEWLPDSRHLALQMMSRDQHELWLLLADAITGASWPILTERGTGATGPSWVNISDDLRFLSDGRRFLWSSERDSHRHLYLYDIKGRQLAQLTSGSEPSVSLEGFDEANQVAFYLAYPEPYADGHLKSVRLRSTADGYEVEEPVALTSEPGAHFATMSPDCAFFADHFSTALSPPRLDLYHSDGKFAATVEANEVEPLSAFDLSPIEFLPPIPAAQIGDPSDDMPLYSKLIEPRGREKGGRHPVVVYVYGGPTPAPSHGLVRNVMNYWRHVPELWMQMMAQQGFGVFSLDNRGSEEGVRGHDWEAPIHRHLGEVELADQLQGVEYLKSLPWVDPDRIGILGGSFGGFLTLSAMLRQPGVFKAGVAFAPVTNWQEYNAVYTERYMDPLHENRKGYEETALPQYARNLEGKLLLIHGGADDNVHPSNSMQLIEALINAGKDFEVMLYPNQTHYSFFEMGQSPDRLWTRITKFFETNLMKEDSE